MVFKINNSYASIGKRMQIGVRSEFALNKEI